MLSVRHSPPWKIEAYIDQAPLETRNSLLSWITRTGHSVNGEDDSDSFQNRARQLYIEIRLAEDTHLVPLERNVSEMVSKLSPDEAIKFASYSMYSTFLTASPGSVLFDRSTLLKRKDL